MKKLLSLLIAIFLFGICVHDVSANTFDPCFAVKKLTLDKGERYLLNLFYAEGEIEWQSTNEDVVTVDQDGLIECVDIGKATIKAKNRGKTYKIKIEVLKKDYGKCEWANNGDSVSSESKKEESEVTEENKTEIKEPTGK